ncbi:MAG: SDR family NAD(P)-dependent oxidoreductase [Staphylococcus hominis]|nr:MAG: SDR family NAD(P)-dependent oxidoreductase [Staphylococcus hominis]
MGILDGKVVLVTGGGNGIGRDCALIAAQEGARVVVNDLGGSLKGDDEGSAGPAEQVAREIRDAGGQAVSNADSVTDYEAVARMVEQAKSEFGGLHAVINPAGILRDKMFHNMTEAEWDMVISVHLKGSYNVCRAAIEHFREQNEGSFVLFTSTSGLIGNIGQTNYGAAKMGIAGLSRILAMEGAKFNIRSNCIAPVAWTRMTQSVPIRSEEQAARMKVMAEKVRADQPAKLAVALASAQCDVSGQIFGARGDEISVYSQPRPVAKQDREEGWTPAQIIAEAMPGLAEKFTPLAPPRPTAPAEQKKAETAAS